MAKSGLDLSGIRKFGDMLQKLTKQREEGFAWRFEGVDDWTTEALFEKLREIGVDTDAARFHDQAAKAANPDTLEKEWDRQAMKSGRADLELWRDLIMLAPPVLWARLAADVKCWQLFERPLYKAIADVRGADSDDDLAESPAVLAAFEAALDYLDSLPPDQRRQEFEEMSGIYYSYGDEMLSIAESGLQRGLAYAFRFLTFLEENAIAPVAGRAIILSAATMAAADHPDAAILRVKEALAKAGDDPYVNLQAAILMEALGQPEEAIRLCIEALSMPHGEELYTSNMSVLEPLMRKAGREQELADLQKRYRPLPAPKREHAGLFPERTLPPIRAEAKVGRNDPCPCGSGKKYKKCCLK